MFDKFTERSRKVMTLARQEAQTFNSETIGTEHIFLAIMKEGGGVAYKIMNGPFQLNTERLQKAIKKVMINAPSPTVKLGQLPFSPGARAALEIAESERQGLQVDVIGTEQLLLGITFEKHGTLIDLLQELDINPEKIRNEVYDCVAHSIPQAKEKGSWTTTSKWQCDCCQAEHQQILGANDKDEEPKLISGKLGIHIQFKEKNYIACSTECARNVYLVRGLEAVFKK